MPLDDNERAALADKVRNGPLRMSDKQWDKFYEHLLKAEAAAGAERDQAQWEPIKEALLLARAMVGMRAGVARADRGLRDLLRPALRRANRRVKEADARAKAMAEMPI